MTFAGFVLLSDTFTDWLQVADASLQPVTPDEVPTFRVYGPSGLLSAASGVCVAGHGGNITGATNATPIVITSANHNLQSGQRVTVANVGGNTAANGTFLVARIDANTYSLVGSVGSGAYTSGGTFTVVGLYKAEVIATPGNGFEAGEHYAIHYSWAVSASARAEVHGIGVT
jgi:hypothetical protein